MCIYIYIYTMIVAFAVCRRTGMPVTINKGVEDWFSSLYMEMGNYEKPTPYCTHVIKELQDWNGKDGDQQ